MGRVAAESRAIHDFLGSAHVFASAVSNIVDAGALEEVAGSRLTLSQLRLLKMVDLTDARTISDVALFLGVSKAAASKAVDKLVRRKLLFRTEGHLDRREISLSLTPASARLLAAYERSRQRRLAKVFRGHPRRILQRTAELLDRLSAELVDHGARAEETCLQCGVYFRDRCLVRELADRSCFYLRHRSGRARKGARNGSAALAAREP